MTLADYEFKKYSQNGEDGIIEYLFDTIGTTNKIFVEFGFAIQECNTAHLSLNGNGWSGLLIDGHESMVVAACDFYQERNHTVTCLNEFITKDNINAVLVAHDIVGEIDLLSIDIDGNDFWVWQAIDVITPRVVVIEYNANIGPNRSLTVSYDEQFVRYRKHASGLYYGASLSAMTNLAHKKGYLLVGCESTGTNAFFVHKEAACKELLNEPTVMEAYVPHRNTSPEPQFMRIQHLAFEEVT